MSTKNSDSASVASAAPLSPFSSTFSVMSEGTSDDPPDLGAFPSVFRAFSSLQPDHRNVSLSTPSSVFDIDPEYSEYISDDIHSTVWDHAPIRSYLSSSDHEATLPGPPYSDDESASDTEEEIPIRRAESPSLGALGSALGFLASERAKLAAQVQTREDSTLSSTGKSTWEHVVSPRRKRRRKRRALKSGGAGVATIVPTPELSYSSAELSSSPDHKSLIEQSITRLSHSRSTPNLLLQAASSDPHFRELRDLASKLEVDFPEDVPHLARVPKPSISEPNGEAFIDPRGSPPNSKDTTAPLVHVFIDHSNILIGFLSFCKRSPSSRSRKNSRLHISHSALTLILERGRSVTRRVMAASSPLYQPMEKAERLGYEVRVFARVPDTGDGMDRLKGRRPGASQLPFHQSVDSDPGLQQKSSIRSGTHARTSSVSASLPSTLIPPLSSVVQTNGRVRYREQGVDELLQLKLHQAIVDVDQPPPGSTIVLATGDGNIGQFNEDGFVGCVRTALKKGWRVELYAWQEGLSRAWNREFGVREWKDVFRIIGLERYGPELIQTQET